MKYRKLRKFVLPNTETSAHPEAMSISIPTYDSLLAQQVTSAVLLDISTDMIETANAPSQKLFGTDALVGRRFSGFLDGSIQQMMLFLQEAEYRMSAWTRSVALQTANQTPLRCEIRGRFLDGEPDKVLLAFIDLDEMERRTRQTEAANMHRHGLMEWQRPSVLRRTGAPEPTDPECGRRRYLWRKRGRKDHFCQSGRARNAGMVGRGPSGT